MNIIISKDKSIRLTQYSSQSTYNLTDIKFYISKELSDLIPTVKLRRYRNIYPFTLALDSVATNYNVYKVAITQPVSLSSTSYDLAVILGGQEIAVNDVKLADMHYTSYAIAPMAEEGETGETQDPHVYPYGLTDDHAPIDIIDRDIMVSKNQNVLVAEDNVSQCIRFRMARYYDGIDLYDKYIYIDYIQDGEVRNISIPKDYIDLETIEKVQYITIKWAVPYTITKKAGTVAFDISASDLLATSGTGESFEPKRQYVWQTKPSKLVIVNNLGPRNTLPSGDGEDIPPESFNALVQVVEQTTQQLEQTNQQLEEATQQIEVQAQQIEEIKKSDIYELDTIDDDVVILGGGGAAI